MANSRRNYICIISSGEVKKYAIEMKKNVLILAVIMMFILTGCMGSQTVNTIIQETETVSEFTLLEIPVHSPRTRGEACHFYKDPVTDVIYIQFKGGYSEGGLCWMPDPDTGKPLKYDHFMELYKEYIPTDN